MAGKRNVKVITDSGCDLPAGMENKSGIDIMHFEIMLDDVLYRERFDIAPREFYALMNNSSSIPTTNQITVPRFEAKFLECKAEGEREVIVVLINSRGSQTYANAVMAKKNLEENGGLDGVKVHIVDSRTYSVGYGYPVVEAAKKLDMGQSAEQVLAYLDDWFSCAEVYIVPMSLRHMKKSGRITAAAAFLGELMGLKPVISLIDGVSEVQKKVRGEKAVIDEAARHIKSRIVPETPWLALCGDNSGFYDALVKRLSKEIGAPPSMESFVGCAVGANTGPNMGAFVIKGANRGKMTYG
ncbi:MAG: DegV family protein [Oscillospiraceae bacterium]|jgi:DegV family protein with EDD domain|nr:DegV family protein [Oscillospiraceae bacterium]